MFGVKKKDTIAGFPQEIRVLQMTYPIGFRIPERGAYNAAAGPLAANYPQAFPLPATPQDINDTKPAPANSQNSNLKQLLKDITQKPLHVAKRFPFDSSGYTPVSLIGNEKTDFELQTGDPHKDKRLNKRLQQWVGFFKLSYDSSREIGADAFRGGMFGLFTGLFISVLRFKGGFPEFSGNQKAIGFLIMPGIPLVGASIGVAHALFTSTRRHAQRWQSWLQNVVQSK